LSSATECRNTAGRSLCKGCSPRRRRRGSRRRRTPRRRRGGPRWPSSSAFRWLEENARRGWSAFDWAVFAEVAAAILKDPPWKRRAGAGSRASDRSSSFPAGRTVDADGAGVCSAAVPASHRHTSRTTAGTAVSREFGAPVRELGRKRVTRSSGFHLLRQPAPAVTRSPTSARSGRSRRRSRRRPGCPPPIAPELGGERGNGRVVALVFEHDVDHHRLRLVDADGLRTRACQP